MGFLSDFLGPLADEAKAISAEFSTLKNEAVDAVTSGSQLATDIKDDATKISQSIKDQTSGAVDEVKKALLSPDNSSSDNQ